MKGSGADGHSKTDEASENITAVQLKHTLTMEQKRVGEQTIRE